MQETTGYEALDRILARVRTNSQDLNQSKVVTTSQMKKENEQKKNLYDCIVCKDTSWIIGLDGVAKRCKCFESDKIKNQWKSAGLKVEDLDKKFSSYEVINDTTKAIKNTASNYWFSYEKIKDTKQNSILFCGNPGCGKTHLSIALANNFITKGIGVVYMPYRDVITKLKQNMLDKDYYKQLIGKYQEAKILLIDDLWKGKVNDTDINIMFEIINYRYMNKKPIIVSTEYVVEAMLGFDEAIGSRIYEMSRDYIVEIRGQENNYRLRG